MILYHCYLAFIKNVIQIHQRSPCDGAPLGQAIVTVLYEVTMMTTKSFATLMSCFSYINVGEVDVRLHNT